MTDLNELIHQPQRLQIMAALAALDDETQLGFTFLRDQLALTDGNLGAHLRKLEDAGYIAVTKMFVARKPQTFVSATSKGRGAFAEHVAALENLLNAATTAAHRQKAVQPGDSMLRLEPKTGERL
jgi:DNA-binding MarR family transcriptional regulator